MAFQPGDVINIARVAWDVYNYGWTSELRASKSRFFIPRFHSLARSGSPRVSPDPGARSHLPLLVTFSPPPQSWVRSQGASDAMAALAPFTIPNDRRSLTC